MVYYLGIETEEEREMKHKHYEMIVAKAANMDLVVFVENINTEKWWECGLDLPFNNQQNFFLCLPRHKGACLHWLNGGKVEYFIRSKNKWGVVESIEDAIESECERLECLPQGEEMKHFNPTEWSKESIFMRDDFKLRIKPKKEKRWIAVNSDGYVMPVHCGNIESARQHASHIDSRLTENIQFIEIEVEV